MPAVGVGLDLQGPPAGSEPLVLKATILSGGGLHLLPVGCKRFVVLRSFLMGVSDRTGLGIDLVISPHGL